MRYGFKPKINCLSTHKPLQNTAASQNAVLTALFRRGKFWNDCRNKFIPIHYVHWLSLFGIHILKKETRGKKKKSLLRFLSLTLLGNGHYTRIFCVILRSLCPKHFCNIPIIPTNKCAFQNFRRHGWMSGLGNIER